MQGGSLSRVFRYLLRVGSVILLVISVVMLLVTCMTVVMFSSNQQVVPRFGGYYLYLQETDELEPDIAKNSLVFAREANNTSLMPGNKVLCYLADGRLALRFIYKVEVNEDGSTSYFPGTAVDQGHDLAIPRTNIFAICEWYSREAYSFIRFVDTSMGLLIVCGGVAALAVVSIIVFIRSFLHK
ncbi:MAG: hypothetical protein IKI21_02065 [Oscillospiraceae bacterium]|nr:hypothetical protein [Oscillospiraceae bacterium]